MSQIGIVQEGPGEEYVIGPLDELTIFVWRNPELSAKVQVRPDGRWEVLGNSYVKIIDARGARPPEALMTTFQQAETGFIEALVSTGAVSSNGEARRMIHSGAISVNGQKITEDQPAEARSLIKKGKNTFVLVTQ